ncbi:hypothetical protein IW261DRAFT_1460741 [Armillaria novae-zelandiae]|uniref:Uncharacterized protein n=1 Tax=Armillaria novae-zelandiae TaxID=153914 RepID=A0AA39PIY0_9AGAR|nr:hypothetical protein IW261DRAFT_1460741 [Armillaria novae-zelandiae]
MSSILTQNSRSFSLAFPFGYQLNLKTTVNGMLSVKFRNPQSSDARSLGALDSSTEMIEVLEESNVNRPPSTHNSHSEITNTPEPIARTPSPVPTEIIEHDPEDITRMLERNGIKIRDYAYVATAEPVAETFDALVGISEYELRLNNTCPTRPHIKGKTLHRLFEARYISLEEATARCQPQDMSALAEYRASPNVSYPWRVLPLTEEHEVKSWSAEERRAWVAKSQVALATLSSLRHYDRCVAQERERLESEEKERQQIEEVMRRHWERENANVEAMKKRTLDDPEMELSPGKKQKVAHDQPIALPSPTTPVSGHAQPIVTSLPSTPDTTAVISSAPLVASHHNIGRTTTLSGIDPSGPTMPTPPTPAPVARPVRRGLGRTTTLYNLDS